MPTSFGRRLLDAPTSDALALEQEAGHADAFAPLDRLIGRVAARSLAGERVAYLDKTRARGHRLHLPDLDADDRAWIADARSPEAVRANGFWSLPQKASLVVGPLSTAWSLRTRGRFGPLVSADERARLALDTPEAVAVWSILAPALDLLYAPVTLRTVDAGTMGRAEQEALWIGLAVALGTLGLATSDAFETIRYGNGWSKLSADARHEALLAYVEALRDGLPADAGTRLRHLLQRPLVEKYYARATAGGAALQKRVVPAALRPAFVGAWGGDWRALVAYLGESVHPQEHVATAIPSVDLAETSTSDLDAVAHATGTTTDDVAAVAAAVFGADPLEPSGPDRVDVLRRFWDVFDAAHARQRSGETSLWGLVDSGSLGPSPNDSGVYSHDLYRARVPSDLVSDVETLWGGHVWTRHPERTVTEWSPHARMAEAFGPALAFWEGVALTAWFVCEGPSSRTDLPGLPEYHAREIAALADAGTPVDPAFLRAIAQAERLLGPPQQVWSDEHTIPSESGLFTITTRSGGGTRRDGFEKVRDLITDARRAWADRHLDAYLRARERSALEGAAERYHVAINARGGKPPTLKQAARDAASATNLWLGGDLGAFYRRIREKSPVPVQDGRLVTRPPDLALEDLYRRLAELDVEADAAVSWTARRLLKPATEYVRWLEATGEAPGPDRLKEFSYYAGPLGNDLVQAWGAFVEAVEEACLVPAGDPVPPAPLRAAPTSRMEPAAPTPQTTRASPAPPRPTTPDSAPGPWWKRLLGG
jgi:hypothetical protein